MRVLPKYCGLADSAVLKSSDSNFSFDETSDVSGAAEFMTALELSAIRHNTNNVICNGKIKQNQADQTKSFGNLKNHRSN